MISAEELQRIEDLLEQLVNGMISILICLAVIAGFAGGIYFCIKEHFSITKKRLPAPEEKPLPSVDFELKTQDVDQQDGNKANDSNN